MRKLVDEGDSDHAPIFDHGQPCLSRQLTSTSLLLPVRDPDNQTEKLSHAEKICRYHWRSLHQIRRRKRTCWGRGSIGWCRGYPRGRLNIEHPWNGRRTIFYIIMHHWIGFLCQGSWSIIRTEVWTVYFQHDCLLCVLWKGTWWTHETGLSRCCTLARSCW